MRNPAFTAFSLLLVFAVSWSTLVVYNQMTVGQLEAVTEQPLEAGDSSIGHSLHPGLPAGFAEQGRKVYVSMGCVSCHTQQVRVGGFGGDAKRGWGRVSVPRDYIYEEWVPLGNRRVGPDLRNVGERITDVNEMHKHIYKPDSAVAGSLMPNYPFLYEVREIEGQESANALIFGISKHAPALGYEIVPTDRADQLVAYLMSLKLNYSLPEVPLQYLVNDK